MKQLAIFFLLSAALFAADDPKSAQSAAPANSAATQTAAANTPTPTCVTPPENELKIVKYVPPQFPTGALTHGKVLLAGVVDETGHLHDLDVLDGHPFLSGPIMEAASQWIVQTYCPQGKPVKGAVLLTTTWQRNQPETEIRVDTGSGKSKKKRHR